MLGALEVNVSGDVADWSVSLVMRRSGVRFSEAAPLSPVNTGLWPTTSYDVIGCRLLTGLLTVKGRTEMDVKNATEEVWVLTSFSRMDEGATIEGIYAEFQPEWRP
jgi:hypothetical protein